MRAPKECRACTQSSIATRTDLVVYTPRALAPCVYCAHILVAPAHVCRARSTLSGATEHLRRVRQGAYRTAHAARYAPVACVVHHSRALYAGRARCALVERAVGQSSALCSSRLRCALVALVVRQSHPLCTSRARLTCGRPAMSWAT